MGYEQVQNPRRHLFATLAYFTRRPDMINAVTLEDARRVAKRLLDGGLLVTVVGRPAVTTANTAAKGG